MARSLYGLPLLFCLVPLVACSDGSEPTSLAPDAAGGDKDGGELVNDSGSNDSSVVGEDGGADAGYGVPCTRTVYPFDDANACFAPAVEASGHCVQVTNPPPTGATEWICMVDTENRLFAAHLSTHEYFWSEGWTYGPARLLSGQEGGYNKVFASSLSKENEQRCATALQFVQSAKELPTVASPACPQ